MPWKLRKAPKRPLYWVVDDTNKHYSKDPMPRVRALAQMRALYAAASRGEVKGGGDVDFAKASYETTAPTSLDGYTLMVSTPTLKIYGREGDYVVAVRGTYSTEDAKADAALTVGALATTSRYKKDADVLRRFREGHAGRYRGIGHSLGGAIIDQFLKDGLLDEGTSFNPAVSVGDFGADLKHKRIYKEGDPLYQLMGRHTKGAEVRKETKSLPRKLISFIPYFGKLYDAYKSHQIEGFGKRGGNREEELAQLRRNLMIAEAEGDEETYTELLGRIRNLEVGDPEGPPPNAGYETPAQSNPATRPTSSEDPRRPRPSSREVRMTAADLFANPRPLEGPRTDAHLIEEGRILGETRLVSEFEAAIRDRGNSAEAEALYNETRRDLERALMRRRGRGKATIGTLAAKKHYEAEMKRLDGAIAMKHAELREMENLRKAPENRTADRQALIHYETTETEKEIRELLEEFKEAQKGLEDNRRDVRLALTMTDAQREVLRRGEKIPNYPSRKPPLPPRQIGEFVGEGRHPSEFNPDAFLKRARARAKKSGYNPKLLKLGKGVYKLEYDGVSFGRKGYGDFLYYTEMERQKKVPKGTAAKKQSVFVKSHSAMKGDWKNDPKSPNNLALRILW